MSEALPLAGAQGRLRKPGRPRLSDEEKSRRAAKSAETRRQRRAEMRAAITPRLLDRAQAALYMGLSAWSLIELENAKLLCRVKIGDLRRDLYDVRDLDRLIEDSK